MKALIFNASIPRIAALQLVQIAGKKPYYSGPLAVLQLKNVPEPALPSQEWVKIRTRMCGFCGSDLNLIMVRDSLMATPFTSFPCILGHELCGEVVEAGKEAKHCKRGDLVTVMPIIGCEVRGIRPPCRACAAGRPSNCENFAEGGMAPGMFNGLCRDAGGGFAEYLVAHRSQVFRVPQGVSERSATLTEPLAVALQAVFDNLPRGGEKVLIVGGGVIGMMIVKAIRGLGIRCEITVIEPSPFNAKCVHEAGADNVEPGGIIETAIKNTGARAYKPLLGPPVLQGGFDRVYDTVGHTPTLRDSLNVTAALGTVSLVGIGKNLSFDPTPLWLKLLTLKGVYAYGFHGTGKDRKHVFEIALDLMKKGKVQVDDMLTHTFPIEEYRAMIDMNLSKGKHRAIKTAIEF